MAAFYQHTSFLVRYMSRDATWRVAKGGLSETAARKLRDELIARNPNRRIEIIAETTAWEVIDSFAPQRG